MSELQGFETQKYPNVETGKDVTLYVCQKCRPQWDTFDKDAAEAHTRDGLHNPELLRPR